MTTLDALQTTLAGEHAALFVVGFLGAQTSASEAPALYATFRSSYTEHRTRRDELDAMVRAAGGDPVAAAPSYDLPAVQPGASVDLAAAGLAVERSCTATYGYLVASSTGAARAWAVRALVASATRQLDLGGRPATYPGR